jgi:bifunctional NMN adenylyltransferase/nudix hydrolase
MKVKEELNDVGVIVGRFQVPELHPAHVEIIEHVIEAHGKVVIVLGLSPLRATRRNPLDFEARKQMILETFPEVNVVYIKDQYSDKVWSKKLDEIIEDVTTPSQTVMLYGGRDSFVDHYEGKHPTTVLESERYFSGNEVRKSVSGRSVRATPDFRAGAVWQAFNQFPTAYVTVDVGVFNEDGSKLLLVRKPYEKEWRLPGGFISPDENSLEQAARRETLEETGASITDPKYVGSFLVDDWRYRGESDKIMTTLFEAKYMSGPITPDDDVAEAGWFEIDKLDPFTLLSDQSPIIKNHQKLVEAVIKAHSFDQWGNNPEGFETGPMTPLG